MRRLTGKITSAAMILSLVSLTAAIPAEAQSNDDRVKRGAYLATAGDCYACHTKPGGQPFAGGRSIQTPFGNIVSPNITPDKEYGIGNWTDDQFYNALHNGIGDGGEYLYPVFPFDHYTKVTRDDVLAIKAYLFSLTPIHQANEPNSLAFPYNIRSAMAVWRELYFKPGEFKPDPSKSAEVNRGAYLVEGLAHCGACHTTRSFLGGPLQGYALEGASVQGWYAPNITSSPDGIGGWSDQDLAAFLKTGAAPKHGVVIGPMAETVHDSLMRLTDEDIHAIVAYLKSTPPKPNVQQAGATGFGMTRAGADLYLSYCASCHQLNGEGVSGKIPPLAQNGSVTAEGPQNIIEVVLGGLIANANYGPMPSFAASLSDQDVSAIADYVRTRWGNHAPANTDPFLVARTRHQMQVALVSGESGNRCEAFSEGGAGQVAAKLPDAIKQTLGKLDYDSMAIKMPEIAQQAKAAIQGASISDLTNGLTAAFCPVVESREGMSVLTKRNMLDQFAQLAYTQLSGGTVSRGAKAGQQQGPVTR
jgi:mono/diheme cytochrome c family protein